MAYEDYTTFTEVDPDTAITVTATNINWVNQNEATECYVVKDYGCNCFDDSIEHWFDCRQTAEAGTAHYLMWMITSSSATRTYQECLTNANAIFCYMGVTGAGRVFRLSETFVGPNTDGRNINLNTWYYLKVVRSGTDVFCYMYTDSARTILLDTFTIVTASDSCRYLEGFGGREVAGAGTTSGDVANLDIKGSGVCGVTTYGRLRGVVHWGI